LMQRSMPAIFDTRLIFVCRPIVRVGALARRIRKFGFSICATVSAYRAAGRKSAPT
jgi:hypothetical protein